MQFQAASKIRQFYNTKARCTGASFTKSEKAHPRLVALAVLCPTFTSPSYEHSKALETDIASSQPVPKGALTFLFPEPLPFAIFKTGSESHRLQANKQNIRRKEISDRTGVQICQIEKRSGNEYHSSDRLLTSRCPHTTTSVDHRPCSELTDSRTRLVWSTEDVRINRLRRQGEVVRREVLYCLGTWYLSNTDFVGSCCTGHHFCQPDVHSLVRSSQSKVTASSHSCIEN